MCDLLWSDPEEIDGCGTFDPIAFVTFFMLADGG